MPQPTTLFLTHLFATFVMTGAIWVTQVVQYPLFARVGRENYPHYHAEYERRITWIVGPMMLLELATGILLIRQQHANFPRSLLIVNLALLLAIWLSTGFLQVPQHQRLEAGFEASAHGALVATNWIRTSLWSVRSLLLFALLRRVV